MLLMLAAAAALSGALDPFLGARAPYLIYYVLAVVVALVCGPGPAAVAVALAAALSMIGPGTLSEDLVAVIVYVAGSAAMIALIERLRRAGAEARARERAAIEREAANAAERDVLAAALESVDAGVHSFDPMTGEGRWDARFRSLLGLSADQPATREALLARVHPDDRARVESAVMHAMVNGGPRRYSVEFRIMRGDGEVRWISSTGFAVFDRERLTRVVGTGRDVTERRRVEAALRESEQRFATLAEGSPVLLWVSGARGNEFVNRAYLEFIGVDTDQQVRGYDWSRYVHPDDRESYLNAYKRAFAAQTRFSAEFRFRRRDGEYRWMRSEATPRFGDDGEFQGHVGATVDITERRHAEEGLRVADRQKDEFLAMIAHELRNPLAPIRNASEVLALRYAGDPQAAVPLGMLRRQSEQLARLLDALLDVTRIAQGRIALNRETLEVGVVVGQAIETVGPLAQAKSQLLRLERDEEPFYVRGDRTRLVQSITNVLENSVKFTPGGGEIVVSVRDAGPDVTVSVRDNGAGIPADLVPRVFDLFVQSERTPDRSLGGLGIGLSLVKRIVEMHGGAVRVASEGEGRGTTVTLSIPRSEAPAGLESSSETANAARRVLIVDDSTDAADSLAMLLKLEGHDVTTAYSAVAALETAEQLLPDVAFIDIGLPQMDGYEVARRLRANERCRAIRLVALTGYGQPGDRDEARRAGFDHHLVKPADLQSVGAILAEPAQLAPGTGNGASAGSV
jgi:PAS domain S-box-containing protein